MASPIKIAILADAGQAKRELQSVAGATDSAGSKIGKFGGMAAKGLGLGLAVAGAAAVKFGADAVKSASNAQQSIGATETVFGKFSKTVIKTSDAAAKSYGLSANEYRENANLLGSLFKNQGVSSDQLAGKTKAMIGQASDLAATFGGTTKDAVGALGSAFKGEFDPLERYGISLKQSDINARLAAKGQSNLTGAALAQAKQVATTEIINKQAAQTHGAFAKETGTLAHQQQVLGAQFENVKAKVGTALLPVLTSFLSFLNGSLGPAFSAVAGFVAPLVGRLRDLFTNVTSGTGRLAPLTAAFSAFGGFITGTVVPAITRLGGYLVSTFGPVFGQVANIIGTKVVPIVGTLAAFFVGTLLPAVARIAGQVAGSLKPVFDQLAATWQARVLPAVSQLLTKFREWLPTIMRVISVVVQVIGVVLRFAAAILGKVLPPLIRFAGFLIGTVIGAVTRVIGILVRIIGVFINVGSGVIAAGRKFNEFAGKVHEAITRALGLVRDIPGKVKSALSGAGSWLVNAGKDIIGGLINGIESMIGTVKSKLASLTKLIPKLKGPPATDRRLLFENGRLIIGSLISGFDAETPAVKRTLTGLTREIEAFAASPVATVRLSAADALSEAASADMTQTISVRLSADQVSQLQRGREITADLAAYASAGGRR